MSTNKTQCLLFISLFAKGVALSFFTQKRMCSRWLSDILSAFNRDERVRLSTQHLPLYLWQINHKTYLSTNAGSHWSLPSVASARYTVDNGLRRIILVLMNICRAESHSKVLT